MPSRVAWFVFVIATVNVLVYVLIATDPLVVQDAWYFVDVFLRKAVDGHLHIGDLFIRRGPLDHSQPLRKILLLLEVRYLDFDQRFQAIAGIVCASLSLVLLRLMLCNNKFEVRGRAAWVWALLCIALVSLNSPNVWTWGLVASGFTSYIWLFLLLPLVWMAATRRSTLWIASLLCVAFLFDVVADKVAILASVAFICALSLLAYKRADLRKNSLVAAGALLFILATVRMGYAIFLPGFPEAHTTFYVRMGRLLNEFIHGGWWTWWATPFSNAVAYIHTLRRAFGSSFADFISMVLALALGTGHIWFWIQVKRQPVTRAWFAAVTIMLLFYGLLAGILYGRVSYFGNWYLREPRYVLIYNFGTVALLLMLAARWIGQNSESNFSSGRRRVLWYTGFGIVAFWQITVSFYAWIAVPSLTFYYQTMATQIGEMSRHPEVTPKPCAPDLPICKYSPAHRASVLGLLKDHKFNLFSPAFQRRNRLYPYPVKIYGAQKAPVQ